MNVPFWLLRLLPRWEHLCPKCRKIVKQNSHECPHCGEKYPLTLKMPPTFLKDPKKLEEYVHKHVFPRVSEFERNYLTKYFTVLFSDGFETGNFNAWTSSDACLIVISPVHSGSYGASSYVDVEGGGGYCVYTFPSAQQTVYLRTYVQFSAAPIYCEFIIFDTPGTGSTWVKLNNGSVGGKSAWHLSAWNATTWIEQDGPDFTLDSTRWYCIEVNTVVDSVNGEVRLWVDGVEILNATGIDTSTNRGNITGILLGPNYCFGTPFTMYFDDVVASDTYNGPILGINLTLTNDMVFLT